MRIVITGATGLIGRELIKKLFQLGDQIDPVSMNGGIVDGISVNSLDLSDQDSVFDYFKNKESDVVIHLASKIPDVEKSIYPKDCLIDNLQMTMNMLEVSLRIKAKRFVFCSSINLYDKTANVFNEKNYIQPDNYYAASKYFGELLCNQLSYKRKFQSISLRISSPYSYYYRRMNVIHKFIQSAINDKNIEIWGSGQRGQDFVYIDDVVDSIFLASKNKIDGVFNIASGQSISMINLAKKVIEFSYPTKSKIVFLDKSDPEESYFPNVDISLAEEKFDYKPKFSIDQGLRSVISSYKYYSKQ